MSPNPLFDRRIPYIFLCILSLFPLLALTGPTISGRAPQQNVEKQNQPEQCGFVGDDNTYGLGIRIGVYLQWVTSSLAYNFVPEEAVTMRGVNNCFQASIFAGLLYVTITKGSNLYAVEAFLMLMICMGGVCSGDNPPEGGELFEGQAKVPEGRMKKLEGRAKRFAYYEASKPGAFIRIFLSVSFCAYGVWFTFVGMDHMQSSPCSTYAFFFGRVNLYTWFRTLLKVVFTIGALVYAISIVLGSAFAIIKLLGSLSERRTNSTPKLPYRPQDQAQGQNSPCSLGPTGTFFVPSNRSSSSVQGKPEDDTQKPKTGGPSVVFSTALLFFILGVELIIRWNHIQGVGTLGSTGQLLPLIIGIGGMFRVAYHLLARAYNKITKVNSPYKQSAFP